MKKIFFVILFAVIATLHSCSSGKENANEEQDDVVVVNSEFISEEFPIYEPNSVLFPIFDTILRSVRECAEIKEDLCVYCLSISRIDEFNTLVSIELRERKSIYCNKIDGLFLFKNAVFKLNLNEQDSVFFKRSDKMVKVKCQKDNIFTNDFNDNMVGVWKYVIENNQIRCISSGFCDNYWRDERYYKTDTALHYPL